ncbi:hypothetical protein J2T09_003388 [Neorhizobium huautlense]|uniref:DUF2442 domain-containing protein n=1 Tax=Neorhizobium huautlense TaxID=67774 RepID=A0ABT9PVX1_9HYPH|nr:hypothetical protein [Neorhizobium huautlense]
MCRKLPRLQPGKFYLLLDDVVDVLRIDRASDHIAPAIDRAEYAARVDAGRFEPGVECIDWPAGKIDDFIVIGTGCLGAAEMDGERGQGGAILGGDRWLVGALFLSQPNDLAAATAT